MALKKQKKDVSKYFHDTLTLMKNYRDASWNVEVAERNLHAEFHAAYGTSAKASLENLGLPNPHLEGYAQSISRSKKMLSVIDSSVNLMRERHKKGELYYWILYYRISPLIVTKTPMKSYMFSMTKVSHFLFALITAVAKKL